MKISKKETDSSSLDTGLKFHSITFQIGTGTTVLSRKGAGGAGGQAISAVVGLLALCRRVYLATLAMSGQDRDKFRRLYIKAAKSSALDIP
jgi:hypothetical protein